MKMNVKKKRISKRNENEGESDDNEFCGYYKQETNYINVWDE